MKQTIIILLLIGIGFKQSFGQKLKSIIIETTYFNEPPTSPKPPVIKVVFKRSKSGNYTASTYQINRQSVKLKAPHSISRSKIATFLNWYRNNKQTFTFNELGLTLNEITHSKPPILFTPIFPIESEFTVKVDSFLFCKQHQISYHDVIGGHSLKVLLDIEHQLVPYFLYASDNTFGKTLFNLQAYFSLQPLLNLNIPEINTLSQLFSKKSIICIIT
ncbi:hypothetical protein BKI52_00345 [marine bacterium AO1-C]|nr:hypothetical protein BKI52_00345 [marine bacterium AO1-C]